MSVANSKTLLADIEEALKDSTEKALKRHSVMGLPVVVSNKANDSVLQYADGRREVLQKKV